MQFNATLDKVTVKRPKDGQVVVQVTLTTPASVDMMDLVRLSTGGTVEVSMKPVQETLSLFGSGIILEARVPDVEPGLVLTAEPGGYKLTHPPDLREPAAEAEEEEEDGRA